MAENRSNPPHLVSVPNPNPDDDDASDAEAAGAAAEASAGHPGRGTLFWIVLAVALFSLVGHAYQGQRVMALETANATLTSELYSTRTALDAYTDRFSAVRDTVAGLNAQIDALNALVADDPAPAPPADGAPSTGTSR